jgi:tRNA A37 N6-isopentenylltransferase MiaA
VYELFLKNRIVIVSGGTGLYLKSIIQGLDEIPDVPGEIVDRWTHAGKKKALIFSQCIGENRSGLF